MPAKLIFTSGRSASKYTFPTAATIVCVIASVSVIVNGQNALKLITTWDRKDAVFYYCDVEGCCTTGEVVAEPLEAFIQRHTAEITVALFIVFDAK